MKRIKKAQGRIWQAMHSASEESKELLETLQKAQRQPRTVDQRVRVGSR